MYLRLEFDRQKEAVWTEKEMKSIKMSTLYELRLLFTQGEKTNYTKEEIVELLDKIASAKEQEQKDKHKMLG